MRIKSLIEGVDPIQQLETIRNLRLYVTNGWEICGFWQGIM